MEQNNAAIGTYRALLNHAHTMWLTGTMADVTQEDADWQPAGRLVPIGGLYAHVALSEDFLVSGGIGVPPLAMSSHQDRTGVGTLPPPRDWHDWSLTVAVDLPALRAYASDVFAATDAGLAALTDADLSRDVTHLGYGEMNLGALLNLCVAHVGVHTGEISAVKGLMDRKGYPF